MYPLRDVLTDTTVHVVFVDSVQTFEVAGVKYGVQDLAKQQVKIMAAEYTGHVRIPESVQHGGLTMTVTELADGAFANNPYLVSVSVPQTVQVVGNKLFDNCERLAAIEWNAAMTLSRQRAGTLTNGNMLIYVKAKENAPENFTNVVVGSEAGRIVLGDYEDAHPFYCLRAFTAKEVEYTHNYRMKTKRGECQGWETLTLPFDVTAITHERRGTILPFTAVTDMEKVYSGELKPFWLYVYTDDDHFGPASAIRANVPYLISMPNDDVYWDDYRLGGKVTFLGQNVEVKPLTTGNEPGTVRKFHPSYAHLENYQGYLTLNVNDATSQQIAEGSEFSMNLRETFPFEAYFVNMSAGAPAFYCPFDNMADGIESVHNAQFTMHNDVYDLSGRKIENGKKSNRKLPKGIYIVNGRKIVKR